MFDSHRNGTKTRNNATAHMKLDADFATCFALLSCLALDGEPPANGSSRPSSAFPGSAEKAAHLIPTFKDSDWKNFHSLAGSHHVILRALPRLFSFAARGEADEYNARECQWIHSAIEAEQSRIDHALSFLALVCEALESAGPVVVIKSLDHWPDLGSDLDLYTHSSPRDVVAIMRSRFRAQVAKQSWGDRLANKWNFEIPGLPELLEVHVRRLGQMGEQSLIGDSIIARSTRLPFGAHVFPVPSFEDRIIVSTLQRMFRHFYIRLCDILDLSHFVDEGGVDFDYLRSLSKVTGLWQGVSTYLKIISDYVEPYRGRGIALPAFLLNAAHFGSEQIFFRDKFLRIPIVPHSAKFYASEIKELLWSGEIRSTLRLGLLPLLATAAAVEYRITGSDKGIW